MGRPTENQYQPNFVSAPGETLQEALQERGMSQAELSERIGLSKKTINEIVQGKAAITSRTALQLERALGIPARFWMNRELQYRQYLAEREESVSLKERTDWLRRFSIKEMVRYGWIEGLSDPIQQLRELLNFFGVASPEQWAVLWRGLSAEFRKTAAFECGVEDLTAWLRQGELEAQRVSCQPYRADAFRRALTERIRPLTLEPLDVVQPALVRLCADVGVAVVFVPQLPRSRASGATRWLTKDKALIQLSLRYKTDDHLWFTFFHEAAHILLHGKREIFVEDDTDDGKEEQANQFAADMLIPPKELARIRRRADAARLSYDDIHTFADDLEIAPGIVVGRLQHEGIVPFSHFNRLKRRLEWAG